MSEKVKITVRDNGSLKVQGEFEIVDVEGFCDGSHKEKFESVVRAQKQD
jgi:hypothetical protein